MQYVVRLDLANVESSLTYCWMLELSFFLLNPMQSPPLQNKCTFPIYMNRMSAIFHSLLDSALVFVIVCVVAL